MGNKKFRLTGKSKINEDGVKLFQIEAMQDISYSVKKGELGGYVESIDNLSDNAWIHGEVEVYHGGRVCGNAKVYGPSKIKGYSFVCDNTTVTSGAVISNRSVIQHHARVYGQSEIDNARIGGYIAIKGKSFIKNISMYGYGSIKRDAFILITVTSSTKLCFQRKHQES